MNEKVNEKPKNLTKEEREKAEIEKQKRLKAQREADNFKRKYFEYYDEVKHNYREDW